MTGQVLALSSYEIEAVSAGMVFFETIGWIYDNPSQAVGRAIDYGFASASPKGYWANGVYNIK